MNHMIRFDRILLTSVAALATAFLGSSNLNASMIGPVHLGTAGDFTMLALTGGIDDSGPLTGAYTVNGKVGVASAGQKFSASGSVKYAGPIYLHTGDTFQSSAPGVPQPQMSAAIDAMLAQAKADAFAASIFVFASAAALLSGKSFSSRLISVSASSNFFNSSEIRAIAMAGVIVSATISDARTAIM